MEGYKRGLLKNYVAAVLASRNRILHYGEADGKAEMDFVLQDVDGQIILIVIMSSANARRKSLSFFGGKYTPYAIPISIKNIGFENGIR